MILIRIPLAILRLIFVSIWLAMGQLWANKLRSVLTTSGIVIGVASVTAVIAVLTGLRANVLAEFEAFGTNKMFVYPSWPRTGAKRRASWHLIRFWPDQFDGLLDHCPNISGFTRIADENAEVRSPFASEADVEMSGIEPDWHRIENRFVTEGRPFSLVDNSECRFVCLITPTLRDKLRLDRDPIGQTVLIADRTFQIVGLVEPATESAMFGGRGRRESIYVPFNTLWKLKQQWFHVIATSKSPDRSDEARAELRFFLRKTRNLKPGEPDTFSIEVVEKFIERFNAMSLTVTMVAGGVVGISLLVGGIGIMNIMLVSVSERTREIGLRKAVGAKPSAILLQFLVEAVVLCFVGGMIGVIFGQALTSIISQIPGAELGRAQIPFIAIVIAFGFSAAVGVIFGLFPAIKAARLNPIEALRHE